MPKCRDAKESYSQPPDAWQSWGVPLLWALLALVLTTLVAAVAWQQRVGYLRSQQGMARADRLRANAGQRKRYKSVFVASMYSEPPDAWQSWGIPFLWALLALVLTSLVVAVAWQQRVGYLRSREGVAQADHLRANARAAERSKSVFVASMSHELRTPMIGIIGLLDALADMGLSGAQIADVGQARASAEDTVRLVNRVLDLSKLEARKMGLCCAPVDPRVWLEGIVRESYWRARQKGIELVGLVDENVPEELEVDAMRLTQALQELIGYLHLKIVTRPDAMNGHLFFPSSHPSHHPTPPITPFLPSPHPSHHPIPPITPFLPSPHPSHHPIPLITPSLPSPHPSHDPIPTRQCSALHGKRTRIAEGV
ncbi:unnamed protein product, partial [Closterium sp. NIES-64]